MSSVIEPTTADVVRQIEALRAEIAELRARTPEDKAAIIVFSGDLDHLLAALVLATGAAASGLETTMFFTFWGLSALKKKGGAIGEGKSLKEKMFSMMKLPLINSGRMAPIRVMIGMSELRNAYLKITTFSEKP